jgi:hypothetical protein
MSLVRVLALGVVVILFYLASPSPAYAYLDPGSGSYVFQLLIAGIVGLAFLVRAYWGRIRVFLSRLLGRNQVESEEEPHAQ